VSGGESPDGQLQQSDNVSTAQQTGILFAELCVRLTKPGGRIGIILPNGYLGNRGTVYLALREWLLRHTYIVGIVGFPRFTFKKSGADVSASAVFLERRAEPLPRASDSSSYSYYVGMVESVGWRVGDKQAVALYQRDPETGAPILDENNEPILDTDFPKILEEFLRSAASNQFPWLLANRSIPPGAQGWSVKIEDATNDPALILDPKRFCPKFFNLRKEIIQQPYFKLGEALEPVKEPNLIPELSFDT
jgi:type I restriction enzyme M protein